MTFNILADGDEAAASKFMDNYRHVNYGADLKPVDASGTDSDGMLSLGTTSAKWNECHVKNNLHVHNAPYCCLTFQYNTGMAESIVTSSGAETTTVLEWNTHNVTLENGGSAINIHQIGLNPDRIYFPLDGTYLAHWSWHCKLEGASSAGNLRGEVKLYDSDGSFNRDVHGFCFWWHVTGLSQSTPPELTENMTHMINNVTAGQYIKTSVTAVNITAKHDTVIDEWHSTRGIHFQMRKI
tara:strand:+ start:2415 stop:3131 length:717 start_codon:yes stop_codon:yes gene_type:complete